MPATGVTLKIFHPPPVKRHPTITEHRKLSDTAMPNMSLKIASTQLWEGQNSPLRKAIVLCFFLVSNLQPPPPCHTTG